jgi:gliding motility-associated-like protein
MERQNKLYFIIFVLTFFIFDCKAQKYAYQWQFGVRLGADFNTLPPTPTYTSEIYSIENASSIADPITGQLLFYTNGQTVYNKNNDTMPFNKITPLNGGLSSTQASLIVPMPGNSNKYYIFTTPDQGTGDLCYSVVDITLDGGLGDITSANTVLMNNAGEFLCGIGNCNNTEYWVATHQVGNDSFYTFKISAGGISAPVISKTGTTHFCNFCLQGENAIGSIKFNPQGTKLGISLFSYSPLVEVYNFDFSTGIISNPIFTEIVLGAYSCSFSPDGTKFFVSAPSFGQGIAKLYQYNLQAGGASAIINSKITDSNFTEIGQLQIGIDGKIYTPDPYDMYFVTIDSPNVMNSPINKTAVLFDTAVDRLVLYSLNNLPENFFQPRTPENLLLSSNANTACVKVNQTYEIPIQNLNNITWQMGDGTSYSGSNVVNHTYNTTGTFVIQVNAIDNIGCTRTDSLTIFVVEGATNIFEISKKNVCQGDVVYVTDYLSATNVPFAYTLNQTDTIRVKSPSIPFPNTGTYQLQLLVQDSTCPNSTNIKTINVYQRPQVNIGSDTGLCDAQINILLKNDLNDQVNLQWNTGSNDSFINVSEYGQYFLIASNPGCAIADTVLIYRNCEVYIPNAFTPNSDNINQYFMPKVQLQSFIDDFSMKIFNRWGQELFSTNTISTQGWDGTYLQQAMPMDTYYYVIVIDDILGERKNYKGDLTLIR